MFPSKSTHKRIKELAPETVAEDVESSTEMMQNMDVTDTTPQKPIANSTVRRTPVAQDSLGRTKTKRRSSGVRQPLGLDLSFGNSASSVRQFRRVSDRQEPPDSTTDGPPGMDENGGGPKALFSEPSTKEGMLGQRMYSVSIGLACQETLANTWDQEKREVISHLAEAFSDLEIIDPEGLYQIVKTTYDKLQT